MLGISYRGTDTDVKKCFEISDEPIFREVEEKVFKKTIRETTDPYLKRKRLNKMQMDNYMVLVLFDFKTTNLNWFSFINDILLIEEILMSKFLTQK